MFTQHFGLKMNPFTKELPTSDLFIGQDARELEARFNISSLPGDFSSAGRGRHR